MQKTGFWALIRYGIALAFGRLTSLKDVDVITTQQLSISSQTSLPLQADGDFLSTTPTKISIHTKPLNVLVPAD